MIARKLYPTAKGSYCCPFVLLNFILMIAISCHHIQECITGAFKARVLYNAIIRSRMSASVKVYFYYFLQFFSQSRLAFSAIWLNELLPYS
jgi:hypothetical protein